MYSTPDADLFDATLNTTSSRHLNAPGARDLLPRERLEDERVRRLGSLDRARFWGASSHWVELIEAAAPRARAEVVVALASALAWQEVARSRTGLQALDVLSRRCDRPRKVALLELARGAYFEEQRRGEEYDAMMSLGSPAFEV